MRRSEVLLGTLLVAIFAVVAITVIFFWFRPALQSIGVAGSPPTIPAVVTFSSTNPFPILYTAQVNYAAAQRSASSWRSDGQLLSSTATWASGNSRNEILASEIAWGYTFYSPETSTVAIISVVNGQATLTSEKSASAALLPLEIQQWKVDSNEIVDQLFASGGTQFLEREGNSILTMTLARNLRTGRLEWFVSLISNGTSHSLTMTIDAGTGEILLLEEIP